MITIRNRSRFNDLFWGPWGELERLQRDLGQIFLGNPIAGDAGGVAMNAYANDEMAVVQLAVPGFHRDDIHISLEADTLTVSGEQNESDDESYRHREFATRRFERSLRLPFTVSGDDINAELRNGVLQVTLPRAASDRPRRIEIQN